jgi:uncharacterized protein YggE
MPVSRRPFGPSSITRLVTGAFISLLVIALFAPTGLAQSTPTVPPDVRTITVSGTGRVNVDPDTADVALVVQTTNTSLEAAQTEVSENLASVTRVLTGAGVAAEDIVTSSYNIYPVPEYDRDGNYEGVSGYQVSATLTVTIRDITQVGAILDSAVAGGANGVFGVSFYVNDPAAPASEARSLAVQDARAKADEYAAASGAVITGVYSIVERSAPEPVARDVEFSAADSAAEAAPAQVPISPGQAEIRVDVDIVFEIEVANG